MNMQMIRFILPIFIVATSAPAQQWMVPNLNLTKYSNNPLTPGYGISDYFELMPDKVGNAKPKQTIQAGRGVNELSATILRGRVLKIRIGDSQLGRFAVAIHTLAGSRVWEKEGFSPGTGNRTLTFLMDRSLAGGIYFISVSGPGVNYGTVRAVVTR
ncbi:MAG: hypothetical protein JW913_06190 [Chitinispirillaceae bacterium]|nr:hypothetical protein [Chitinispirillaceae bacterium]